MVGRVRLAMQASLEHITINLSKVSFSPDSALDFRTTSQVVIFVPNKEDEITLSNVFYGKDLVINTSQVTISGRLSQKGSNFID